MLEIRQWINEREYTRLAVENTFKEIDVLYSTNPGSPSIPRLQELIREKETSIAELTDKIGSGLCVIDFKPPNTLEQKGKKSQTPSPRANQGLASTKRHFLSPTDTSTL